MKTLIITALLAATAMPVAAQASDRNQVSRSELRGDRRDVREERREYRQAVRSGDRRDIREERREYNNARREYREDRSDWQRHRAGNPGIYRRGNWTSPYRYQRFSVGVTLNRNYYGNRYWINDPYRYHLPAAGRNQRWVRHYDDVLLVDMRTGRVIRVYNNFYW